LACQNRIADVNPKGCLGVCDPLGQILVGAGDGLTEVVANNMRAPASFTSPGNVAEYAGEVVQRVTTVAESP
jgi:hypothetical protein